MTANKFPTPCVEYKTNKYTLEALVKLKTFYWAPVLLHTLNGIPELKLAPLRGVILAGEPGNGRHTIADALSGTLSRRGYGCFARITGVTLDTEDVADACAAITGAIGRMRQHERFCLLVDCLEDSRHNLAIQELLRQQMDDNQGRMFLILITETSANISAAMQAMMTTCQFQRPNLAERRGWLKTSMEGKIPIVIDGGVNSATLSKECEGFSWRQMMDLRTLLRRTMAMKYFQDPDMAAAGEREAILTSGAIHLTKREAYAALACIRGQGAAVPAVGAVQYVAAMPAGAVPAGTTAAVDTAVAKPEDPAALSTGVMGEEETEAKKREAEFHRHPEKMSFADLTNIANM